MEEQAEAEAEAVRVEWEGGAMDCIALLKDIISYVLFTHNQIPQPFGQLECSTVENIGVNSHNAEASSTSSERRERNRRARAAKKELKNREKLKVSIQVLLAALQAAFKELPEMPSVLLILGSSTKQPFAAYDIQFHRICPLSPCQDVKGLGKSTSAEIMTKSLSKKITRALVSQDRGPLFTGPMKLFLFIKADATSCMPQDFVPKRGYTIRFRKKQAILRVIQIIGTSPLVSKGDIADSVMDESIVGCNDMIWFQCKLNIKGGQCHDIP